MNMTAKRPINLDPQFSGVVYFKKHNEEILKCQGYESHLKTKRITEQSQFKIGSLTKSMTSYVTQRVLKKFKVPTNTKVIDILPDFPTHWKNTSIENLLSHTSGIPEHLSDINWAEANHGQYTPNSIINKVRTKELNFDSGSQFSYSNTNYLILCELLECITSNPVENTFHENLFKGFELNSTSFDYFDNENRSHCFGYKESMCNENIAIGIHPKLPSTAGALISNINDLVKWNDLILENKWIQREIIRTVDPALQYQYIKGFEIENIHNKTLVGHNGFIPGFLTYHRMDIETGDSLMDFPQNCGHLV